MRTVAVGSMTVRTVRVMRMVAVVAGVAVRVIQLALLAASLSTQIALLIASWSYAVCLWLARIPHDHSWHLWLALKQSLLLFFVSIGCFAALAGSSSLRCKVATIGAKDEMKAAMVIYVAMASVAFIKHVIRYLWESIGRVTEVMVGEGNLLLHVMQNGLFLARYRDATSFGTDFVICFTNRLLKATLPNWKFALGFSLAENVFEVGSLWYSFEKEVQKFSQAEERWRLAGSDSSDGAMVPSPQNIGLVLVNYFSNMFLEVLVTLVAVGAAVIFAESSEITGLSNKAWDTAASVKFLAANLIPEVAFDVVGIAYLQSRGVQVHTIVSRVHGSITGWGTKVALSLAFLPYIVIAARERRWGA